MIPWRRLLATVLVLLGLTPAWCLAQGEAHLRWNECSAKGGSEFLPFACDTDDGLSTLVASFRLDQPLPEVYALRASLMVRTMPPCDGPGPCRGTDLPSWWELEPGGCRAGSVAASVDFRFAPFSSGTGCVDPWRVVGGAGGILQVIHPVIDSYWGIYQDRLLIDVGWDIGAPGMSLAAGTEYYGFWVAIDHVGTTGTAACADCCTPLFVQMSDIRLQSYAPGGPGLVSVPPTDVPGWVTWQGFTGTPCGPTPARRRSWGQVKGLYR